MLWNYRSSNSSIGTQRPASSRSIAPQALTFVCVTLSIFVVSFTANLIVAGTILGRKHLRNITHLFVFNQCIADLLRVSLQIPPLVVNILLSYWPFGPVYCNLSYPINIFLMSVSILNVCAISIDRYFSITSPLLYQARQIMSKKIVLFLLLFVWLEPLIIALLPMFAWRDISFNPRPGYCFVQWTAAPDFERPYLVCLMVANFVVPSLAMNMIYARIFVIASKHAKRVKYESSVCNIATSTRPRIDAKDMRIIAVLATIVGFFLVCWLPFFVNGFVLLFSPKLMTPTLYTVSVYLSFANAAINPLIYALFTRDIRHQICYLFCRPLAWRFHFIYDNYGRNATRSGLTSQTYSSTPHCRSMVTSDFIIQGSNSLNNARIIMGKGAQEENTI